MHTASGIFYDTAGEGDPVLLLMGFGMRGIVWRPQIDTLAKQHQVAWYDNRGLGLSSPQRPGFGMAQMAEDALEVADALGWERFHAVGVSMGGMVAQELAIRYPARVRTLALIATQPGGPLAFVPPASSIPRMIMVGVGGNKRRGRLLQKILHPPGALDWTTEDERRQRFEDAHAYHPPGDVRRNQLRAVRRHDTRDRLGQIAAPTLVVQPAQDKVCRPEHSYTLVDRIPRARLLRLPDAGHAIIFHAAPQLNQALLKHFQVA